MGTQQLTSTFSLGEHSHESDLCPDEILTILRTLDDNSNSSVFNVATADILPLKKDKNRISKENQKRKRPTKSTTSSSLGLCSDEESDEGRAVLSKRKIIKRQKGSISLETCMEDGSGKEVGGLGRINNNAKVVSHIAVERNRRKLMNEHLAVLRQLMPSFHVKKGDQASIIGGVINYINELHHVLRSLEAKKRRNMYTSDMRPSPGVASSPRFSAPRKHLDTSPLSPRKQHFSPRPVTNFPVTPRTPQSTSSYYKTPSYIPSLTLNTTSFSSSIANRNLVMNIYNHNNSGVDNELVTSIKSDFADVDVKFCGANLQLQTISSKMAGQSVKIASAIEDLSLEILQLSINTIEETMLNAFTIKIGIDCQLSAEELAQKIQNTFC